jgi:hypothetical protein
MLALAVFAFCFETYLFIVDRDYRKLTVIINCTVIICF